jgi:hypothetical protein
MSSDFDAIGFNFGSPQQFVEFITQNAKRFPATATPIGGSYIRAGGADGAEVWMQTDPSGTPIGAHPHFSGVSRFRAKVIRPLAAARGTPLDGSLCCAMLDDQPGVPLIVDVPDFAKSAAWATVDSQVTLQIAALPRGAHVYPDHEAFAKSPLGKFSPDGSFIPSGTFRPDGAVVQPPTSDAILSGRVIEAHTRMNELTKAPYVSLVVATLGGRIDVVFPAAQIPATPLPNSIVAGSFALSARLVEPQFSVPRAIMDAVAKEARESKPVTPSPARRPSLLGRLFGRT